MGRLSCSALSSGRPPPSRRPLLPSVPSPPLCRLFAVCPPRVLCACLVSCISSLFFPLSPYEPSRPACHITASRASSGRCHTLGSAVLLGHSTSIRSPLRSASAYSFCLRACSPLRYPPLFLAAVQHLLEHPSPSRSMTPPPPFLRLSVLHRFASRLARFVACAFACIQSTAAPHRRHSSVFLCTFARPALQRSDFPRGSLILSPRPLYSSLRAAVLGSRVVTKRCRSP